MPTEKACLLLSHPLYRNSPSVLPSSRTTCFPSFKAAVAQGHCQLLANLTNLTQFCRHHSALSALLTPKLSVAALTCHLPPCSHNHRHLLLRLLHRPYCQRQQWHHQRHHQGTTNSTTNGTTNGATNGTTYGTNNGNINATNDTINSNTNSHQPPGTCHRAHRPPT